MHEDSPHTPSDLELRIKRITRYMTIGISGLLVMCVLLFFYIGSIKQSERTATDNSAIQANEMLKSDICQVYPKQSVCELAKSISENPTQTIVPKDGEKGDKGDKGETGRGVSKWETVKGNLMVTYTDGKTENAGSVVGENGKNGINGKDGRGILSTAVAQGILSVRYTDGTVQALGNVVGPAGATGATGVNGAAGKDGTNGKDGINGTNGTDGISVTNVGVDTSGTVTVTYSDGRTEIAGKIIVNTITGMECNQETNILTVTVTDGSQFTATVDCTPDGPPVAPPASNPPAAVIPIP